MGRSGKLNKRTGPGVRRKGQFCAKSSIKAKYSEAQIKRTVRVTTICNGEDFRNRRRQKV